MKVVLSKWKLLVTQNSRVLAMRATWIRNTNMPKKLWNKKNENKTKQYILFKYMISFCGKLKLYLLFLAKFIIN